MEISTSLTSIQNDLKQLIASSQLTSGAEYKKGINYIMSSYRDYNKLSMHKNIISSC